MEFIERTGVDILAISIGTAHGSLSIHIIFICQVACKVSTALAVLPGARSLFILTRRR